MLYTCKLAASIHLKNYFICRWRRALASSMHTQVMSAANAKGTIIQTRMFVSLQNHCKLCNYTFQHYYLDRFCRDACCSLLVCCVWCWRFFRPCAIFLLFLTIFLSTPNVKLSGNRITFFDTFGLLVLLLCEKHQICKFIFCYRICTQNPIVDHQCTYTRIYRDNIFLSTFRKAKK